MALKLGYRTESGYLATLEITMSPRFLGGLTAAEAISHYVNTLGYRGVQVITVDDAAYTAWAEGGRN